MRIFRLRVAVPAVALVLAPLGLTGCGLVGGGTTPGGTESSPIDDGPEKSRTAVQAYLDAMKAKDAATGRGQLCAPMQAGFDASAKGPTGDFASHFKVTEASVTDVRSDGGAQQVGASVTVVVGDGDEQPMNLLFTVVKSQGQWCIAKEVPGGKATGTPDPDTSPAG
ncbi:hypothetical protein AB0J86_10135 [Micromonospora sp. NPDC049559]|uniref:Rv0361 family membrane protein n=1 Tax=Micromonospora sp. NPDC049559 TaxID=3155923 RepID=UPI003444E23F